MPHLGHHVLDLLQLSQILKFYVSSHLRKPLSKVIFTISHAILTFINFSQPCTVLYTQYSCNVRGSPVESFSRDVNSTTSMSTKSFPLFAFANYHEIEFKCSFDLCFHYDDCEPVSLSHIVASVAY